MLTKSPTITPPIPKSQVGIKLSDTLLVLSGLSLQVTKFFTLVNV